MNEKIVEIIAKLEFDLWKDEKIKQGYHNPKLCPTYQSKEDDDNEADLIHCNKCLGDLINYEDLMDFQKKEYKTKAETLINTLEKNGVKLSV